MRVFVRVYVERIIYYNKDIWTLLHYIIIQNTFNLYLKLFELILRDFSWREGLLLL